LIGGKKTAIVEIPPHCYMRTLSAPDIFACGDCAEKRSFFTGRLSAIMLASVATRMRWSDWDGGNERGF